MSVHQGRVLMISCAFPPTGGPGVQRSVKFAKYLPSFDWHPIVWCAGPLSGLPRDDSLLEDLPADVTILTHDHSPPRESVGRIHDWCRRASARLAGTAASPGSGLHPDEFVPWCKSSVDRLLAVIEKEAVDVIYSTFSPASNHCLAMKMKERTGLPWVADFRDLWTDDYRYPDVSAERRRRDRALEKKILSTADVVIGVSPSQTRLLAGNSECGGVFTTITNGFDATDFASPIQTRLRHDRFVLSHVGRLDRYRSYDALFQGLDRFVSRLGPERDRFVLNLVGHVGSVAKAKLAQTSVPHKCNAYVSHSDAIAAMRTSDTLLLTVPTGPNAESVIPGKLFEYLGAQKPILTVGPLGGECERIVMETESGLTASVDAGQIAAGLDKMYRTWQTGTPMSGCRQAALAAFDRKALTGRLAEILDALVLNEASNGSRKMVRSRRVPVCSQ